MSLPNELVCKTYLKEKSKVKLEWYNLVDIESVLDAVSEESGISKKWLVNTDTYKTRDSDVIKAVAAYSIVCQRLWPKSKSRYKEHNVSTTKIGQLVGRDHSTVLHHLKKEWIETITLSERVLNKML